MNFFLSFHGSHGGREGLGRKEEREKEEFEKG